MNLIPEGTSKVQEEARNALAGQLSNEQLCTLAKNLAISDNIGTLYAFLTQVESPITAPQSDPATESGQNSDQNPQRGSPTSGQPAQGDRLDDAHYGALLKGLALNPNADTIKKFLDDFKKKQPAADQTLRQRLKRLFMREKDKGRQAQAIVTANSNPSPKELMGFFNTVYFSEEGSLGPEIARYVIDKSGAGKNILKDAQKDGRATAEEKVRLEVLEKQLKNRSSFNKVVINFVENQFLRLAFGYIALCVVILLIIIFGSAHPACVKAASWLTVALYICATLVWIASAYDGESTCFWITAILMSAFILVLTVTHAKIGEGTVGGAVFTLYCEHFSKRLERIVSRAIRKLPDGFTDLSEEKKLKAYQALVGFIFHISVDMRIDDYRLNAGQYKYLLRKVMDRVKDLRDGVELASATIADTVKTGCEAKYTTIDGANSVAQAVTSSALRLKPQWYLTIGLVVVTVLIVRRKFV